MLMTVHATKKNKQSSHTIEQSVNVPKTIKCGAHVSDIVGQSVAIACYHQCKVVSFFFFRFLLYLLFSLLRGKPASGPNPANGPHHLPLGRRPTVNTPVKGCSVSHPHPSPIMTALTPPVTFNGKSKGCFVFCPPQRILRVSRCPVGGGRNSELTSIIQYFYLQITLNSN